MNVRRFLLPLAGVLLLPSCVPVVIAAAAGGAAVGADSQKEGGLPTAGDDIAIHASINNRWFTYNTAIFRKLHLSVNQGRVLITGVVQKPDDRVAAVRLAWQVDGVVQVINEIQIADSQTFLSYADDKWITTRIRTALTFERDVKSVNYSIDTVNGVVYLMGVATDQEELDDVIGIAKGTPHVKQVVSYVKKNGEVIPEARVRSAGPGMSNQAAPPEPVDDSGNGSGPASAPPEPLGSVDKQDLQPQPVEKEDLH